MDLKISRLLLFALFAIVFLDDTAGCKSAPSRTIRNNGRYIKEWYCPSEDVLLEYEGKYWCVKQCASCPNGYCDRNRCNCFPGTQRDRDGICGKICPNCENGWCSSSSRCECNKGFTWSEGRCAPETRSNGLLPDLHVSATLGDTFPLYLNVQTASRTYFPENFQSLHTHRFGYHRRGTPKRKGNWHDYGVSRSEWTLNPHHSYNRYPVQGNPHQNPWLSNPRRPLEGYPESPWQSNPQRPLQTPSGDYPQQSPQRPLENDAKASPQNPSSSIPRRPLEGYPESPWQSNPQRPLQTPSGDYPQQSPQRPLENDAKASPQNPSSSMPRRPLEGYPESPWQSNPQRPLETPSGDYPQQSPQRPLENNAKASPQNPSSSMPRRPLEGYPESPSQSNPQRPLQAASGDYPQQSPQRPLEKNPRFPSQSNPQSPNQVSWRPRPVNPESTLLSAPLTPSEFIPQQSPQRPHQYHPESPSQTYPEVNLQTPPPTLAPELRPQQKPEPPSQLPGQPQPSSAGRPHHPYSFEKVDPQLGSSLATGRDQYQTCQTDYLWDPKLKACIPYESAEGLEIHPRMDDS